MKKKSRRNEAEKIFLLACVFLAVLSWDKVLAGLLEEEQLGKDMAKVTGKAPNCIIITDYVFKVRSNHVMVTRSSTFIDIDGKKISLKELKIPCVAKMRLYHKETQPDPELIQLVVKEYAKNTSDHFTMKEPFERQPE